MILIRGPKRQQHVTRHVEHVILLIFRQNQPQNTVGRERRTRMRADVLPQFSGEIRAFSLNLIAIPSGVRSIEIRPNSSANRRKRAYAKRRSSDKGTRP
jgi:hypothetical protein